MTEQEEVRILEAPTDANAAAGINPEPATDKAMLLRHGGGPATAEGKLVSSQNARKHSFYARKLFRTEDRGGVEYQEYTAYLASLNTQYQPCGVLEELLVERIATESIRFGRLLQYEQEEFAHEFAFLRPGVDRILRYQAAVNKQLYQAIAQLERLQRQRLGDNVPPPLSVDLRIDASVPNIADRLEGQEAIPGAMLRAIAPAARLLSASTTDVLGADECTDVEGLASTEETAP